MDILSSLLHAEAPDALPISSKAYFSMIYFLFSVCIKMMKTMAVKGKAARNGQMGKKDLSKWGKDKGDRL